MLVPTISSQFIVAEASPDSAFGYEPYGGCRRLWLCKDHEVIIAGPAETGKTRACLEKLDALAWKYPGLRGVIVRKTYRSAVQSVIVTFEKKVLGAWDQETKRFRPDMTPVRKYGGERPDWYDYPNGSRIVVGGMDKSGKVLSSEYDIIYVNQAEELELGDWETLSSRCTGRAGNMPHPQIIGDCNPDQPQHWILARAQEGKLTFIESRHEDNPLLFDPQTREMTPQGLQTMAVLDSLTGVRKERLRYGRWVQAEGIVYEEYDAAVHDFVELPATGYKWYVAGVDWGYTHPGVIGVFGLDGDDRMDLIEEIYRVRRTDDWWADRAEELDRKYGISVFVCDPSEPAYIEKFKRRGLTAVAAYNGVRPGITAVKERMKRAEDGRPRLRFRVDAVTQPDQWLLNNKRPTCTRQEFSVYVWNNRITKDTPVKENDHGCDMVRYAVCYVDNVGGREKKKARARSRM